DLVFGPDGNLYVVSHDNNSVLRYNGATGAFINAFVASGSGGLNAPFYLAFGPDGNLYVSGSGTDTIKRYNGSTGAFLGDFANRAGGILFSSAANLIANNGLPANNRGGVFVLSGTGNPIQSNSIFLNAGLGIDLGNNGVTPNDA